MEDSKYPDLKPDTLGDLKSIERLAKKHRNAPKISWGEEYKSWPVEKRLDFAEKLAASMNQAADLLQQERNKVIEVARVQEQQLRQLNLDKSTQHDLLQHEMGVFNAQQQKLNELIVELTQIVKQQKKKIKELEGGNHS